VAGAQPVKAQPHRYTPHKNEIENQVKEVLANGIIQQSAGSFASPVLLVKKMNHADFVWIT
jgi:hypothetical protein